MNSPTTAGAFGRALSRVEPRQLCQSDRAYLRFIFLALHNSVREVGRSLENERLVRDVLSGIDLLIDNAGRRFSTRKPYPGPIPKQRVCGECGWSWAVGKHGQLLCANPESPHCYDVVPVDMRCSQQDPNPELDS
jgi:hypothetical protein